MFDLVDWIGTLLFVSVLVALFSGGISFWRAKQGAAHSLAKSSSISAIQASGLLAAVPIAVLAVEEGWSSEFVIVFVAMVVGALFMAAVVGFPVALYVAKRFTPAPSGEIDE